MFEKREMRVKLVKPQKDETIIENDPIAFNEKAVIVTANITNVANHVAKIVCAYMVLDAARKVVVRRFG